jgi:hypothetical protein
VPSFKTEQGQFAMDQIYMVRGQAKLNGINVDPEKGAATVMVPSDAGGALPSIKKMTISAKGAQVELGGVPIGKPESLAQDIIDKPGITPPTLRQANLDDLKASLLKKLDLGPFKLGGDAKLRMAPDGTAFIDAMAQLKGPFKAGSGPIRTAVTVRATQAGKLSLEGIHLKVKRGSLGAVIVADMELDYDGNGLSIKGKLLFPPVNQGISINRFRTDAQGNFKELDVDYLAGAGQGINVGPGIFLIKIGGGLSFDPDEIRGRAGVSVGPSTGGGCATVGIDADLTVHFGSPPPFFVDAKSTVQVLCIPLAQAHLYFDSTGLVDLDVSASLDLGPIYVRAGIHGRLQLPDWQIDLRGEGGIRGLFSAEIKALLSNVGLAGCARVQIFPETPLNDPVYLSGGAGTRFSNGRGPFSFSELVSNIELFVGCSLRKWSPFGRDVGGKKIQVAQADGSHTFSIGAKSPVVPLEITGAGGAPAVQIITPKGETLDASQFGPELVRQPNLAGMTDPPRSRTLLFVRGEPGKYTVKPVAGSVRITDIKTADVVPEPKVKVTVGGAGASRMLRYDVKPIPGQVVRLVEQSADGQRKIKTVKGGGRGIANFVTSESKGTSRTILAQVVQDGLPREILTVARFKAPSPKPVQPKVKVRRRGKAATLTWGKDPYAARYELTVATGRGRRFFIESKGSARSAKISGLTKGEGATIRIVGITANGKRGAVRLVKVKGSMKLSTGPSKNRWDKSRKSRSRDKTGR